MSMVLSAKALVHITPNKMVLSRGRTGTYFSNTLYKLGYNQGQADHTLFTKIGRDGKRTILIVYVDDIIITGDNHQEIQQLKQQLKQTFEVKELGELRYFLGLEVARSKEAIFVS